MKNSQNTYLNHENEFEEPLKARKWPINNLPSATTSSQYRFFSRDKFRRIWDSAA